MRPNLTAVAWMAAILLAASLPAPAGAQVTADAPVVPAVPAATVRASAAGRISEARDRVLPVVVSILNVREDYRQGESVLSVASGSGTVVSADGHIATNAHVTQNGKSFRIVFADGRELPARLVGTDTLSDLAVLQAVPPKPEKFAYAEFAKTPTRRSGDT
jgi:serine protease Do